MANPEHLKILNQGVLIWKHTPGTRKLIVVDAFGRIQLPWSPVVVRFEF